MVGTTQWSMGSENRLGKRNYEELAKKMNDAAPAEWDAFVNAIRINDRSLMTAHADAFYGGNLDETFLDTEDTWFGANPMWFWNSVLTPDQMHQVMRESRARTCELMLAAHEAGIEPSVEFYLQCGHPQFRTVITWDGAVEADAELQAQNPSGISGAAWRPRGITGPTIRIWVFTPYSAGYGDRDQLNDLAWAPRQKAAEALLASYQRLTRAEVRAVMTEQDFYDLVTYSPNRRIFQGSLAVEPGTGNLPNVAGLSITFRDSVTEPYPEPNGEVEQPMLKEPPLVFSPTERSGIEISWQIAGPPPAPGRFEFTREGVDRRGQQGPLDVVQANILQPHVRNSCVVLLLQFTDPARGRAFLQAVHPRVKSASGHQADITTYRQTAAPIRSGASIGDPYVGVGLSYVGYEFLEVPMESRPEDPAFRAGMSNRALGDPQTGTWEATLRPGAHAVVVIGSASPVQTDLSRTYIRALAMANGVVVLSEQPGATLSNRNGDGVEHFGYVDGRSQPLYLQQDQDQERDGSGTTIWDPARDESDVLVDDPAYPGGRGSYFVFRKLEQNVRQFHVDVLTFAADLGLNGPDAARAGALLVGRFEDGTPLAVQQGGGMHSPVTNDFDYADDPNGLKCPVSSHMRLMNDRDAGARLLARRGVPYGERGDDVDDPILATLPTEGVGLLFMAFASNLVGQFEDLQRRANAGGDPVVGQGQDPRPEGSWPTGWGQGVGDNQNQVVQMPSIRQSVTMRGGEYFFMPSIPALENLPQ